VSRQLPRCVLMESGDYKRGKLMGPESARLVEKQWRDLGLRGSLGEIISPLATRAEFSVEGGPEGVSPI